MLRGLWHCFVFFSLSTLVFGQKPSGQSHPEIIEDREKGLMWIADGNYVVRTGVSHDVILPRADALRVLARLNAGDADNFGYHDWRLPTKREMKFILDREGVSLDKARGYWNREGLGVENRVSKAGPAASGETKEAPTAADDGGTVVVWPIRGSGIAAEFGNVVLFATNSIQLKENANVISGDVVVNDFSEGPFLASGMELTIGQRVDTPAGYDVKADSIKIKTNATVASDVHYNELVNNGTITGAEFPGLALPIFDLLPSFQTVGGEVGEVDDIFVAQGGFLELEPGDYGVIDVNQNSVVRFTGGAYTFTEIDFGNATRMEFEGPSEIRVSGKFSADQNSYIGAAAGFFAPPTEIIFYIAGINGNNGNLGATPKAAKVGLSAEAYANFYVPNGTLHLRQNTVAIGAFLARDVLLGPGVEVTLNSAFNNQPPEAQDDSIAVNIGGIATTTDSGDDSLLDNDDDPNDGDDLTVTLPPLSEPEHGTLVLNADGTFVYTHDGGASTTDSFTYEVCDDGNPMLCDTATVNIAINPNAVTVTITKSGDGGGTVTSLPVGLNCGNICVNTFATSSPIFLEANPDEGSVFAGWTGDEDCIDGQLSPFGDKNCTAIFNLAPPPPENITVTVQKAGEGNGQIFSSPGGIACGTTCSAEFPEFTRVSLEVFPDDGSVFAGWSGALDCLDGFLNGTEDTTCIATFDSEPPPPETHTVRVIVQGTGGGTVSSNPVGLFCSSDCSLAFEAGIGLTLLGRPDGGSQFVTWGGDCSGTGFSTFITVDSDKTCTATFDSN